MGYHNYIVIKSVVLKNFYQQIFLIQSMNTSYYNKKPQYYTNNDLHHINTIKLRPIYSDYTLLLNWRMCLVSAKNLIMLILYLDWTLIIYILYAQLGRI